MDKTRLIFDNAYHELAGCNSVARERLYCSRQPQTNHAGVEETTLMKRNPVTLTLVLALALLTQACATHNNPFTGLRAYPTYTAAKIGCSKVLPDAVTAEDILVKLNACHQALAEDDNDLSRVLAGEAIQEAVQFLVNQHSVLLGEYAAFPQVGQAIAAGQPATELIEPATEAAEALDRKDGAFYTMYNMTRVVAALAEFEQQ